MTSGKNLSLHGFRGLASILVVIYHIYGMAYIGGFFEKREVEGIFILINNLGPMSVNLFFMISGYLIIGSLARKKNIKNFIVDRIIRIYPVFLALHIVIFLFGPFINYEWLGDVNLIQYVIGFVSNLFLLPGIFDLPIAQKNAWSLSYEFTFYIISALFFLVTLKINNKLIKIGSLIFLTLISFSIIFLHHTAIFFVLGVIVYYGEEKVKNKYSYNKYYFLNGIILLPMIFVIYKPENALAIIPLVLSLVLFWVVINEEGLLSKFLRNRIFQFLGTISYSLYLIHPFALFPLKIIFSMEEVHTIISNEYMRICLFGIAGLIISLIGSYISYVVLEDKVATKLKKWTNSKLDKREVQRSIAI